MADDISVSSTSSASNVPTSSFSVRQLTTSSTQPQAFAAQLAAMTAASHGHHTLSPCQATLNDRALRLLSQHIPTAQQFANCMSRTTLPVTATAPFQQRVTATATAPKRNACSGSQNTGRPKAKKAKLTRKPKDGDEQSSKASTVTVKELMDPDVDWSTMVTKVAFPWHPRFGDLLVEAFVNVKKTGNSTSVRRWKPVHAEFVKLACSKYHNQPEFIARFLTAGAVHEITPTALKNKWSNNGIKEAGEAYVRLKNIISSGSGLPSGDTPYDVYFKLRTDKDSSGNVQIVEGSPREREWEDLLDKAYRDAWRPLHNELFRKPKTRRKLPVLSPAGLNHYEKQLGDSTATLDEAQSVLAAGNEVVTPPHLRKNATKQLTTEQVVDEAKALTASARKAKCECMTAIFDIAHASLQSKQFNLSQARLSLGMAEDRLAGFENIVPRPKPMYKLRT